MIIRRIGWIALVGCSLASSVCAESPRDWYASLGVGWGYPEKVTFEETDAVLEFDRGRYLPVGAVGAKFGDAWRMELDASLRRTTPEILYSPSAGIEIDPDKGDLIRATSLMVNVLRDFPVGIAWRPYVGAGIGVTRLDFHLSEIELDQRPRRDIVNDQSTAFAYQLIAGFTVPVSRRLDLAADYRWWQAPWPDLQDVTGADLGIDHTVHSAWLQLRYHAPNAGVMPSPAPRHKARRGFYVSAGIGGGFAEDANEMNTVVGIDAFDLGPAATVAAGYVWRERWRFELEGAYLRNTVDVIDFRRSQGEDSGSGRVKSYSLMANAIFRFAPGSSVRPMLGLGVGLVHSSFDVDVSGVCEFFVCGAEHHFKLIDDNDSAYVAQAIVGVDVAVSKRITFTADYRYWITSRFEMRFADGSGFEASPYETRLRSNTVMVGVRYSLGNSP